MSNENMTLKEATRPTHRHTNEKREEVKDSNVKRAVMLLIGWSEEGWLTLSGEIWEWET